MKSAEHMEAWKQARDISHFFNKHKDEKYRDFIRLLTRIDVDQAAYGDWVLYQDTTDGAYYGEYFSIGD